MFEGFAIYKPTGEIVECGCVDQTQTGPETTMAYIAGYLSSHPTYAVWVGPENETPDPATDIIDPVTGEPLSPDVPDQHINAELRRALRRIDALSNLAFLIDKTPSEVDAWAQTVSVRQGIKTLASALHYFLRLQQWSKNDD